MSTQNDPQAPLTALTSTMERGAERGVICENVPQPLSSIVAHHDVECIERFFAAGFPVHVAIHHVRDAEPRQRSYTELHSHEEAEINILIPDPIGLSYEIRLGDEVQPVSGCASIFVPANLPHSANVIKGSGYFITLRLRLWPIDGGQFATSARGQR